MGLSKSNASINKKRIVNFSWRFCYSERSSMSQVIVGSYDKGVEGITGIQVGILDERMADFLLICRVFREAFSGPVLSVPHHLPQ